MSCMCPRKKLHYASKTFVWTGNRFSFTPQDLPPFKGLHYRVFFFFCPHQPGFSQDSTTEGSMDFVDKTYTQKHHIPLICQLESHCCVKSRQNLSYPCLFSYIFSAGKYPLTVAIAVVFRAFNSLLKEFLKRSRTNIRPTDTSGGKREAPILNTHYY